MNQDLVRLDRFDGSNFTRWQDKVRFLLTALKIFYILDPTLAPLPEPKENDTPQVVAARKKREEDELICRGHILNALSDRLYDLYTNTNSAREIWEALENKYKAEEEGTKKFLISQYIDFKFFDEKPLLPQIHELQVIVNKLKVLKIELPEAFQVGAIVAKLPSSWKGYRKRILHKSEDYSLEEIQKHLRIEEESRSRDKMVEESNGGTNKANAVSKANHPRGKVQGWWYDTCATVHVTYDKSLFKTFEDAKGDQEVQMGNEGNPRIPMKKNEISPYELWKGSKPNIEAINDEMDSIMSNQTWELVDLPPGSKPIGCKWVFRRKYHTDGMIQTFKARLVVKGFKQREGIDYFDTYAPVARTTSIRILFALASIHNLFVHQMDVKMAFLNGDLNEEVYMEQPKGFVLLGNENKVCKACQIIIWFKTSSQQWHEKFDHAILSDGFRHNNVDKCLYSKTCDDYYGHSGLNVDDMLILSDDMRGIIETKRFLSSTFKMKDLGEVDTILGIKVKRNSGGYALNQTHYIEKVVSKFSHLKIKDANTPFDSSIKLEKNDVSKLSRFTSNPSVEHWKAIGRVLGYLKNTKELSSNIQSWVFTLGGGAVSWGSKKQTCISHSTMEVEFIALAATGKEAEWLRDLMMDIPFTENNVSTVSIHCDSQATLARAYSGVYNGKSRHISIRHEYVDN
ncbi:Retrovirus-related Pol polyprotein from transposon TNT 1-94 [Vitis vinifera]|uniref:Retrovirus-related Pol polyprotein from transposon TNT 1-94 n=1 Tax=Vitis vinifera TaxID=29760 RepID=A0A438EAG3_VITVI|nr:Retrovirus-related Pol polyprotein from transposon TNT 1-94 [Vitis vinifera]